MNNFHKIILAIGTAGFIVAAPLVNAIPFTITTASFTPGSGYGVDLNESSGTLLDVQFSTSGFTTQTFNLNSNGASFTFNFGTVELKESDAHGGISSAESDNLGVTAHFTFTDPLVSTKDLLASGTAFTGSVSDIATDYTLVWSPITVAFGSGGLFDITMDSLSFNGNAGANGTTRLVQTATITLRNVPDVDVVPPTSTVPEPATLALFGLGLLGVAALHRKPVNNNAV